MAVAGDRMSKGSFVYWKHRFKYWYKMFNGTSYYHQPLGMGRKFVPGQLDGYFSDMTGKADWQGGVDNDGIAYIELSNGKTVYFPVMLCQKALGHWDRWLMQKRDQDREEFLLIANWLKECQDSNGGWNTGGLVGQKEQYKYSAMAQGQTISVIARAYKLTNDIAFERACKNAMTLMRKSVQNGGVCIYDGQDVFLEECPGDKRNTILNGWIFSLFGVYDYLLLFKDEQIQAFYMQTCASLTKYLYEYDAGYWSYYDNGTRRLASPFYHNLHISQLEALKKIIDHPCIGTIQDRWIRYRNNSIYKLLAIMVKGMQKLKEPDAVMSVE
jgi:heparosan-N-sulfate-glucuronate 5-epimerase